MSPALLEPAEHALAVLRRARARGERFVGALLPGATARRMQAAAVVDEWAAAHLDTHHDPGPLWVVLGDGASLGLGASTRAAGYVCLVAEALAAADGAPWRLVNLAEVGADLDDVVARQLPRLAELSAQAPVALVTCVVGAADVPGRPGDAEERLRTLLAALPAGGGRRHAPGAAAAPRDGLAQRRAAQRGGRARRARDRPVGRQRAARAVVRRRLPPQRRRARRLGPRRAGRRAPGRRGAGRRRVTALVGGVSGGSPSTT